MKRFIGRPWDASVEEEAKMYGFKLVNNHSLPAVAPTVGAYAGQLFSPQDIGSLVLKELKKTAEGYIGGVVERVVLAVPVDFDDDQIEATKEVFSCVCPACVRNAKRYAARCAAVRNLCALDARSPCTRRSCQVKQAVDQIRRFAQSAIFGVSPVSVALVSR